MKAFAPGYIQHMVKSLLPDLVDQLEPYWADFNASGGSEFGDYLAKRGDEVSEALLSVTDARAARLRAGPRSSRRTRPSAAARPSTSTAALPAVGALVQTYAG